MLEIHLTDQEAFALRRLLDLAVKAGGMEVAAAALQIDQKIVAAAQAVQAAAAANGQNAQPVPTVQ